MAVSTRSPLFDAVVGQERAVAALEAAAARPVHAYLFVGPPGTGKAAAATAFAASLLCPAAIAGGAPDGTCDSCRRVIRGLHPDVIHIEREGASINIDTAREVTRAAMTSPLEGERKVVVLHDFHLVRDSGPALLKTIEEPPPTTFFVILAELIPPELVTIASRCVRVDFQPLTPDQVAAVLVAEGVSAEHAGELAEASGGRIDRARLLASDAGFAARRRAWHEVPGRLDGNAATAFRLADELIGLLDSSVEPLKARHAEELAELTERNERAASVVGTGKAKPRAARTVLTAGVGELEERQRREVRRQRTDELRAGLAVLAATYRERLGSAPDNRRRAAAIESVSHVDRLAADLEYNPGELLAVQALLVRLGRVGIRG